MCCKDRDVKSTTIRQSVRPIQRDKNQKTIQLYSLYFSVYKRTTTAPKRFFVWLETTLSLLSFFDDGWQAQTPDKKQE